MRWRLLLCVSGIALCAAAAEGGEFKSKVSLGTFVMNKADNLWGRGPEHLDSLAAKPRGVTHLYPLVMVDLNYKNDAGIEFFLGSPPEEPIGMGIGVRQRSSAGTVSALLALDFFQKGWENPYQLDRSSTNVHAFGGTISWQNIFGSGGGLSYRGNSYQFDKDIIGQQYADLRQDGSAHRLQLSYNIGLGGGFALKPEIEYERGEFTGASNSYNRYGGELGLSCRQGELLLLLKGGINSTRYDATHPVFQSTREETGYSSSLIAIYERPFGWEHINSTIGVMFRSTDANIPFFAADSTVGFVIAGYRF